jgi:hypothetical protein
MRCLLALVFACAVPLAVAQGASDSAPASAADATLPVLAGKVELVEGDVRFYDKNQQLRVPKLGDWIYQGDSIVTGADGEVHFSMEDGGYIGVRPNTKMRIVNYKAEGGSDDTSVIGLLQGSFRSVTGWIASLNRQNYVIRTPTATIGVRGTEHEPLVIPDGSAEGEPGTYDRVHNGETEIRTPQGTVGVKPNQAGFAPRRGAAGPRVLDRIPQQLQQRLQAHRQFIEQRRKQRLEDRGGKVAPGQQQNQRKLQQEERRNLQEQRREQQQKLREERRQQAEKAKLERERKKREAAERERNAAKGERRE